MTRLKARAGSPATLHQDGDNAWLYRRPSLDSSREGMRQSLASDARVVRKRKKKLLKPAGIGAPEWDRITSSLAGGRFYGKGIWLVWQARPRRRGLLWPSQ